MFKQAHEIKILVFTDIIILNCSWPWIFLLNSCAC